MKKLLFVTAIFLLTVSCKKEEEPLGDCGFEVSYATDIRPIIESSCKTQAGGGTGCHDAWIDDYSQIKTAIDNNNIPNKVLIEMSMPKMPDAANEWGIDSLTISEKEILQCWIDQGYSEN